ncbi:MAG: CbtB-domain containing protein [Silicimonas sp.]|nr:CbtB-domain containing protein [Silicimonas sp.]
MNTQTLAVSKPASPRLAMAFAALLGLGIVVLAGHVQASAVHDAAHDTRHATGFPCH